MTTAELLRAMSDGLHAVHLSLLKSGRDRRSVRDWVLAAANMELRAQRQELRDKENGNANDD